MLDKPQGVTLEQINSKSPNDIGYNRLSWTLLRMKANLIFLSLLIVTVVAILSLRTTLDNKICNHNLVTPSELLIPIAFMVTSLGSMYFAIWPHTKWNQFQRTDSKFTGDNVIDSLNMQYTKL